MELKEVREKIEFAIKAVKDVPEPFRVKAFEVILSNSIMSPLMPNETTQEPANGIARDVCIDGSIEKLSEVTKISREQLGDVYNFGETEPEIIAKINGSESDKQIQGSMLLLLAMKYYYGQEWVKASFLSQSLEDCGIGALKHLAENLDKHQSEFLSKGKTKGTEYKLSTQGEQKAIDSIRGLFKT